MQIREKKKLTYVAGSNIYNIMPTEATETDLYR